MPGTVRDVRTRSALRRYRAERLLRKGFPQLRAKVLAVAASQLRANGIALDPRDLEACYAQAWHGLYSCTLAGEQIDNPSAWLVVATVRRAIDEARSNASTAAKIEAARAVAAPSYERDLPRELDDRARLRELFEALRARLTPRECEAASLCYLQGLSRSQAAARMGISEARMRKLMEGRGAGEPGVAAKVGELLTTIRAGGWCEQQSSLMRAYAFGILDPDGERHALAVAHTRDCPACRARVAMLRGLASVLPPLPLALPLPAGGRTSGRALTRLKVPHGGGAPLTAKLAVTGLALIGAGAGYLAAQPSASPARAGAVHLAAPSASIGPRARRASAPPARAGRHRKQTATVGKQTATVRPSGQRRRQVGGRAARVPLSAPASASEFSPERVRGETPPSRPTASSPSLRSGREGEFGLE